MNFIRKKLSAAALVLSMALGSSTFAPSVQAAPFGLNTSEFTCVLTTALLVVGGIIELAGIGTVGGYASTHGQGSAMNEPILKDQLQAEATAYVAADGAIDISPTLAYAISATQQGYQAKMPEGQALTNVQVAAIISSNL